MSVKPAIFEEAYYKRKRRIHVCEGKTAYCRGKFITTRENQRYCVKCELEKGTLTLLRKEIASTPSRTKDRKEHHLILDNFAGSLARGVVETTI